MQPHHHHDCDVCKFLGAVPGPRGPVDLYVHATTKGYEYLARMSSEGPDYTSCSDRLLARAGESFFRLEAIAETIHRLSQNEEG
jgi:hypothetical protein